ncbi:MAG: DNA methyltransferase [Gammaproteobacteria bacterium]|nr:DNA methyltransferase [Gammaproteobacteria bacterium]MCY4357718.1 DNA methyltransferase [Gammaproteobacteria bacterium]
MTDCNVPNRTIFCDDNLDILRGINSECIDLIYLDPPFNKNKKFTAPIGSSAEGAEFSDIFRAEDVKDEWLITIEQDQPELFHYLNGIKGVGKPYNFAYLAYMAVRLIECHRVLKQSGSIYLHCDHTMSHYLKTTMDCIFGEHQFRNEIIWYYKTGGTSKKWYGRKHDIILFYSKSSGYKFNMQKVKSYLSHKYGFSNIKIHKENDRYYTMVGMRDVWDIPALRGNQSESTQYPTQKPVALLNHVIIGGSDKGDIVLDPFCGCATTCVAAERLERHWIGVDVSFKAYELVKNRLEKEASDPNDLLKYQNKIFMKTDPPARTDLGKEYREQKYVYAISHPAYPDEYKIGIAKDWKSRLNAYQTSDPDRQYKIEFKMKTPDFKEIENYIHDIYPNKHEWVQGDLEKIKESIKQYKAKLK